MAKFTVFFKDKPIQSSLFDSGVIHIGRDETNDIQLDSLAIAPAHAVVVLKDNGNVIKQLNDDFPLIVNGETIRETNLENGDKITIGKHAIVFNSSVVIASDLHKDTLLSKDIASLNQEIKPAVKLPEANLQVISGKHIGRLIPLKKAMTRLGRGGDGIVVISKRKEGYFISALEHDNSLQVNQQPLGEQTLKLQHNDTVIIDNSAMQFFID